VTQLLDKKVCFYRWLFADPIKPCRTNTERSHWGALIGWPVVPNCSTQRLLSLWYGQGSRGCLSGQLCKQLGWLCLLALLTNPPYPSTLPIPLLPVHLLVLFYTQGIFDLHVTTFVSKHNSIYKLSHRGFWKTWSYSGISEKFYTLWCCGGNYII